MRGAGAKTGDEVRTQRGEIRERRIGGKGQRGEEDGNG